MVERKGGEVGGHYQDRRDERQEEMIPGDDTRNPAGEPWRIALEPNSTAGIGKRSAKAFGKRMAEMLKSAVQSG